MNSMDLLKALSDINEEFLCKDYKDDENKASENKEVKYNNNFKKELNIIRVLKPCLAVFIILFIVILNGKIFNFNKNKEESLKNEICINNYLIKSNYFDYERRMGNRRNVKTF